MTRGIRMRHVSTLVGTMVLAGMLAAPNASAGPNTGKLSFSGGMDITTAYFFRGLLQERNGFIVQPYGEIGVDLYQSEDGPIRSLGLVGGIWASVHSEETGNSGTGAPALYETDFYAGVNAGIGDYVEAGVSYVLYTSPNNAFDAIQEVDFSLGLDDSEWLGALALNPSAVIAIETENQADGGHSQGTYAQVGIEPSFDLTEGDYALNLALPITTGFSVTDYYEDARGDDNGWGYTSFGAVLSVPLAFIPEEYGAWGASLGGHLYTFNSNLRNANDHDTPWGVGTFSLSMSY